MVILRCFHQSYDPNEHRYSIIWTIYLNKPQFITVLMLNLLCGYSAYVKKQIEIYKETTLMAVHHGGKIGRAAKILAKKDSSKPAKSRAGKTLANHKAKSH